MPEELEDDVPVYFSPEDEAGENPQEFERQALLEDEPPREWQPYQPAITLEQVADQEKTGDHKFRPPGMRPPISETPRSGSETDAEKLPAHEPGEDKSTLPSPDQSRVPSHESGSLPAIPIESAKDGKKVEARTLTPGGRVLLVLAAVNLFAIGFWCGSFLFPNRRVVTSLYGVADGESGWSRKEISKGSLADLVARVSKTVVNVDVRHDPGRSHHSHGLSGFFSRRSQHNHVPPGHGGGQSQASGILISSDGYILTNNHVLGRDAYIRVTLLDNREFPARIVGRDAYSDLAVLKIAGTNLPVARFGNIKKVRPGQWVVVIGSPYGFDHTVTVGTISALNRIVGSFNHHIPLLQTDAAINPGNSGGPLFDTEGRVVGIATAAITRNADGLAFAIPVDVVNSVAKQLIARGSIARPYLGIKMRDLDPNRKRAHTLPSNPVAVMVESIMPGGPAEKGGLLPGDTILKVNDLPVTSSDQVRDFLKDKKPGFSIAIVVRRLGTAKLLTRKFKLGTYPSEF